MEKEIYKLVVCDYKSDMGGYWSVDAWTDPEKEDNGISAAKIDCVSGNIYYCCEDAKYSPKVRELAEKKQAEVRAEKKKVWVVSIVEYKADENYLDSYTELYADEQQAKARVDEYSTKAIDAAPEHDGLDDGGELVGEHGYVTYFKNGDIAKVKYAEKELK